MSSVCRLMVPVLYVAYSMGLLASATATTENPVNDELVNLAATHFHPQSFATDEERQAFTEFFLAVHQGRQTRFQRLASEDNDISKGGSWGLQRSVQAEWLNWVCVDQAAVKLVQTRGIRITDARIIGNVDLDKHSIAFELSIQYSYFDSSIWLNGCTINALTIDDCFVNGSLSAAGSVVSDSPTLKVLGNLYLDRTVVRQAIQLSHSEIAGSFSAYLENARNFSGEGMEIGKDASFDIKYEGEAALFPNTNLEKTRISEDLQIIIEPPKNQLISSNLEIDARRLNVGENVSVYGNLGKVDLNFSNAHLGGQFRLEGDVHCAFLRLGDAYTDTLLIRENSWPTKANLVLQGFKFEQLAGSTDVDAQIQWLRLQATYSPQPYKEMVTVLKNMGYSEAATKVGIAEKWDEGGQGLQDRLKTMDRLKSSLLDDVRDFRIDQVFYQTLGLLEILVQFLLYDILWIYGFGLLIQYGYRPWNALFLGGLFVLMGWAISSFAEKHGFLIKKDAKSEKQEVNREPRKDRNFSALMYSVETFVPLMKLGVAERWKLDGNVSKSVYIGPFSIRQSGVPFLRWYWIHTMAGWILTGLWVVGFTGIIKH